MTNDDIFEASLPILLESLFPESIEAAHQRAKESHYYARQELRESLEMLSELRDSKRTEDVQLSIEGVRISIRHSVREIRFLKRLRTKFVRVMRGFALNPNGNKMLPYALDSRRSASPKFRTHVVELCTCLIPYLVPAKTLEFAEFDVIARLRRAEFSLEQQMAENWKLFYPDIFYSFTIEPPISLPTRESHPLARELFDRITSSLVLSRNELLVLEKSLLG